MPGAIERVILAQPLATAGQRVIASPFQFATTEDDNLQIVSANSLPGVVLAIQGRRVTTAGEIVPFSMVHVPTSDRMTKTENFKLGSGALLNLVVFASSGSPLLGQTFASVRLIHGLSAATVMLGALIGGYVTAALPLAYPGSPIETTLSAVVPRVIDGTSPGAGNEINEVVPTNARWELMGFTCSFLASATVATRRPSLRLLAAPLTQIVRSPSPRTFVAGEFRNVQWAPGLPHETVVTTDLGLAGLPIGAVLTAGMALQTNTESLQVGDQYTNVRYLVRETLEVNT